MFEMEGEVNNDLNVSFGSALNDVVDVVSWISFDVNLSNVLLISISKDAFSS
jgi:hypothetical protein